MSGSSAPYSAQELFSYGAQRAFADDASEAAFLIGGIGTGCYSIGARGQMRDWEIFNRPGKGNRMPYTFFALNARGAGMNVSRVLEAKLHPPFSSARGYESNLVAGLPRFARSRMTARFPFVHVELSDPELPLAVALDAFNPFIPLNADESGIPAGIMEYRVRNLSDSPLDIAVSRLPVQCRGVRRVRRVGQHEAQGRRGQRFPRGKSRTRPVVPFHGTGP